MAPATRSGAPAPTSQEPRAEPERSDADGATRQARLWATVIALPLTVLVAVLFFSQLNDSGPAAEPTASATPPVPQSTAPVEMAAPPLADRPATVCRALLSRLPATVRGLNQRAVTAGAEQNAAYGDPALTVACGIPAVSVAPADKVWVINRVCWHVVEGGGAGLVLTTVDREVPVRLTVPPGHEQTVQWAAPVSESVVAAVPSATRDIPTNCRP